MNLRAKEREINAPPKELKKKIKVRVKTTTEEIKIINEEIALLREKRSELIHLKDNRKYRHLRLSSVHTETVRIYHTKPIPKPGHIGP